MLRINPGVRGLTLVSEYCKLHGARLVRTLVSEDLDCVDTFRVDLVSGS